MKLVKPFAGLLLATTVIGALASLFGPQERWLGIDIGTAGTVLFGFALWVGALLYARHPDRVFSLEWSLAERRAWVGVLFLALIFLSLLRHLWAMSHHEPPGSLAEMEMPARHFIWNLLVLLIAWAVVAGTIGRAAPGAVEFDERDQRIRRNAHRAGDAVLTMLVVAGICLLVVTPSAHLGWWLAPLIAANVLIGVLICKSLAEHVWLVASYSRARV